MAVYPRAQGMPDYSADSGGNFIPELWSPNIQLRFYKANVSRAITNNSYEGEIKQHGDKVRINTLPDINTFAHNIGMTLPVQTPSSTPTSLTIDKGQAFNFLIDDVSEKQSKPDIVKAWSDSAGIQLSEAIDKDILQGVYSGAHADNIGAAAGVDSESYDMGAASAYETVTKINILDYFVDMGNILDEQSAPDDGKRWVVLPPWAAGMLKKSDIRDVSLTGDSVSPLRNGRIGIIDNMNIHVSRQLLTTTDTGVTVTYILFGHPIAISFAEQLTKTESIRSTSTFGTLIRGLNVYGYDVVKSEGLGYLYATKG